MSKSILIAIILFVASATKAQINRRTHDEFGFGISAVSTFADIGGAKGSGSGLSDFSFLSQRPGVVGFYKYNFENRLSLRANLNIGLLYGTDDGSRNEKRQFSFNTPYAEFSGRVQYYLIKEEEAYFYPSRMKKGHSYSFNKRVSVYLQAGVGFMFFKPIPNELLSEATNAGYVAGKSFTPTFPLGLGVTMPVSRGVRFFAEGSYVLTLTDYLDGYNNTSFSQSNDMFFTLNFGFIYQFGRDFIDINKRQRKGRSR